MRPWHALAVFLLLMGTSVAVGWHSYRATDQRIREDLSHALTLTLSEQGDHWITPDTIQTYRQHIRTERLRERSFLTYGNDNRIHGYTTCGTMQVLSMSDQRLSLLLLAASMSWSVFALGRLRRKGRPMGGASLLTVGNMSYDASARTFYDAQRQAIRFTPMQHELMEMFFSVPRQELAKADICERLWPKKEDASETLYTLMRRIKPIVEARTNLKIEVERGRAYRLKKRL